jgi:hypothetical protein
MCLSMLVCSSSQLVLALSVSDLVTDRDVIERSVLLKNMIDDLGEAATSEPIPIQNVSSASLCPSLSQLICK